MARYSSTLSNEERLKGAKVLFVVSTVLGLFLVGGILLFSHETYKAQFAMIIGGGFLTFDLLALMIVVDAKFQIKKQLRAIRHDGDYSRKEGDYSKK